MPGAGRLKHDRADYNKDLCAVCSERPVHAKARCKSCLESWNRQERIFDADYGKGRRPFCSYCRTRIETAFIMMRVVRGGKNMITLAFHNIRCFQRFNHDGMEFIEMKRAGTWKPRDSLLDEYDS